MAFRASVLLVMVSTATAAAAPSLTPVFTVAGGEVLDVDATRILYVAPGSTLHVQTRATGVDAVIGPIATAHVGRLTSTGAYFGSVEGAPGCATGQVLYRWTGSGAAIEVDRACTAVSTRWKFGGDWAARQDTPLDFTVVNLITGGQRTAVFPTVTDALGTHGLVNRFVVSDVGDLYAAWTKGSGPAGYTYYRWRNAVLDAFSGNTGGAEALAAHGDAYAFATCTTIGNPCSITRCLGYFTGCVSLGQLARGLQMTGAWTYADEEDTSILANHLIARISPTGVIDEVGAEGDVLEASSATGALTVNRGGDRYLVRADGSADLVDPMVGRAVFLPDALYLLIGTTLYRVDDPGPTVDAGVIDAPSDPDAGVIDAPIDPDAGPATDAAGTDPDATGATIDAAGTDPDATGATVDAGTADASTARASNDGCSTGRPAPLGAALLIALALSLSRRRRRARR